MKAFTKSIKEMIKKDKITLTTVNNSKRTKMTKEQIEQHINDRKASFTKKYQELLEKAETPAQIGAIEEMLYYIDVYTR